MVDMTEEDEPIIKLERKLYQNNKTLALTVPREIISAWNAKKGDTILFMSKGNDIVIRKKKVFDGVRFR
jgi:hypothetical protein